MPPKWSLGYHQCRWSYESAEKVKEIARTFRDKGIPCDVIWMDIDYMDGFRCFTFDKVSVLRLVIGWEHFSDPESMVNDLHARGFKAIWMLDPGIKKEDGYFVYESGSENNVWIKKADGEPFVGEVWPGPCVFPDFTQQSTRLWWANLVKDFISNGVDGIWNDMNEPAVFKTVTKTMPVSNIHRGDPELGGCQNHFHYHNVYGMLMARSTQEGMKMANSNKRPFVLTRAGFIGSQRYAATWTGDNLSNWEHLHMSLSMVLQLGLSGQPYSGPDIGGFAGNATPKLFGRWMGLASFFPFCRGHSEKRTADHEPWSFGVECEEICRLALLRRYRLLPHIYTLFYLAHTKGTPVTTPVFFADSTDAKLRNVENSFLLGPLLICARFVQLIIRGKGRFGYFDGSIPKPSSTDPSFANWDIQNSMVMACLICDIVPEICDKMTVRREEERCRIMLGGSSMASASSINSKSSTPLPWLLNTLTLAALASRFGPTTPKKPLGSFTANP
ncbi:hypothetical protein ZIOFF_054080 [Zingiber officinale]|uniref:Glycoside hydrolase family 31 TIM barrel domain-containing protein n=1 Tax=Zingiber officinale TaxID=94328 RepID=A0A8J5FEG3_ZINOF|nr:hypothetical protein ZIOFF_054080 [Zingiber officinale]